MDEAYAMDDGDMYPILLLPKRCTNLETNCEVTDNVFIDINVTSPDTEGNNTCIYSGFCNIKLIDTYDVNIQSLKPPELSEYDDSMPVIIADQPLDSQSEEVWIDPARSPYVYNHFDLSQSRQDYSVHQESHTSITVEQHSTYVTKNVYNYKEAVHYSNHEEFEQKVVKRQVVEQTRESSVNKEDEFECGVFLSQLPEEIMNEKNNRARQELKFIGIQSDNSALRQLMSPDIQSFSKQRKTILFLGPHSHCGQTIQQIGYYDPKVECSGGPVVDNEIVIDLPEEAEPPRQKRYQCAKCQQIFNHISDFRHHMTNHGPPKGPRPYTIRRTSTEVQYVCDDCGKNLKTKEKFERHCLGHGDPDLECNKCHKVFASKFTLRVHRKIHNRKYLCEYCIRSYSTAEEKRAHAAKVHFVFMCDQCDFVSSRHCQLIDHSAIHANQPYKQEHEYHDDSSETELAESLFDDVMSDSDVMSSPDPDWLVEDEEASRLVYLSSNINDGLEHASNFEEQVQKADSVIQKIISNKMFLLKKGKKNCTYKKICDVCLKTFDRISDLKRHLIEHIIRSTLAKTPVNLSGTLTITCEVCQEEVFTRIDQYKAHLREHAKLTLYKCTFCNKTFSDSSNFSKHKKIHGATYFQCDLCQRKFNSKKMLTRHMEYHIQNKPISCRYCDREFHFESTLNKHIKSTHTKELACRFRCRFCHNYFGSLREKWDHEWRVHNVRKMIVDCLICGAKFRKYAELKRHCTQKHGVEIPTAKKLLRKKK